jgi:hypothetical protein
MQRDPDEAIVPLFKHMALPNEARTALEGRPIFDDREVVELRSPGKKDYPVFLATQVSHWVEDPISGGQTQITYAERFAKQYQQFKAQSAQTKSGTPLTHAPFLTEARRAELRALNIYTVEALATVDGQELKNLGQGGRDMKNAAMEFMEEGRRNAPNAQMSAELEALRARNATLEEDVEALKNSRIDTEFKDMSVEQLKQYIAAHAGHVPAGSNNRKTLEQMAMNCRPDKAA